MENEDENLDDVSGSIHFSKINTFPDISKVKGVQVTHKN